MQLKKKYGIRSINFGTKTNPARLLASEYCKKHGKNELSRLVRKLLTVYLSDNPEYKEWRKHLLLYKRKEIGEKIAESLKQKQELEAELENMGMDPEEIYQKIYID